MLKNNFKRNHAKHEKCNVAIKETIMASVARRHNYYLWRRSDYRKLAAAPSNYRRLGQPSALCLQSILVSHRHNHIMWIYLT